MQFLEIQLTGEFVACRRAMQKRSSKGADYFGLMAAALAEECASVEQNDHLRNFYVILPPLVRDQ